MRVGVVDEVVEMAEGVDHDVQPGEAQEADHQHLHELAQHVAVDDRGHGRRLLDRPAAGKDCSRRLHAGGRAATIGAVLAMDREVEIVSVSAAEVARGGRWRVRGRCRAARARFAVPRDVCRLRRGSGGGRRFAVLCGLQSVGSHCSRVRPARCRVPVPGSAANALLPCGGTKLWFDETIALGRYEGSCAIGCSG